MGRNHVMKKQGEDTPAYPTLEEVKNASNYQIRHWYNTLPSPDMKNESQIDVMNAIIKRNRAYKKAELAKQNTANVKEG